MRTPYALLGAVLLMALLGVLGALRELDGAVEAVMLFQP